MKEVKRYNLLDILRSFAIISMVVYHTLWDLANVFDVSIPWFNSDAANIFQLSIRWSFILISGFSWSMGKNRLKRALTVLACSVIITAVTAAITPKSVIIFGVLSMIGTGMLVTIPLDRLFRKAPYILLALCCLMFLITYNAEIGRFSIGDWTIIELPNELYANYFTSYLGFPPASFSSSDYVPIIPWLFLYWIGYFLYILFERKDLLKYLRIFSVKPLEWLGRHSLFIYMLHQPIIYAVLFIFFKVV